MTVVIKSTLPIWSSLILSLSMGFNTNEISVVLQLYFTGLIFNVQSNMLIPELKINFFRTLGQLIIKFWLYDYFYSY